MANDPIVSDLYPMRCFRCARHTPVYRIEHIAGDFGGWGEFYCKLCAELVVSIREDRVSGVIVPQEEEA